MDFSELQGRWQPIPAWVRFLISLGYKWPRTNPRPRRIALISMPCDSPAAGLIALGAMARDLELTEANDLAQHAQRLVTYARNYVRHCKGCQLETCNPGIAHCGLSGKHSGILRSTHDPGRRFQIKRLDDDPDCPFWILPNAGGGYDAPPLDRLHRFHIDGEPAPQWLSVNGHVPDKPYTDLIGGIQIVPANLQSSYSGLCFAGRITGEGASKEVCDRIHFNHESHTHTLTEMLTIHDWSACKISRMAYFNARTQKLDRKAATPNLVVADGDVAFLRACDHPEFQSSDVIGVIHRTLEYDRLEAVGIKMQPNLWFAADTDTLCELPSNPKGISIAVLKGRNCP